MLFGRKKKEKTPKWEPIVIDLVTLHKVFDKQSKEGINLEILYKEKKYEIGFIYGWESKTSYEFYVDDEQKFDTAQKFWARAKLGDEYLSQIDAPLTVLEDVISGDPTPLFEGILNK